MRGQFEPHEPFVVATILQNMLEDRAAGGLEALGIYSARFPDHEAIVAREYAAVTGDVGCVAETGELASERDERSASPHADHVGPYRILDLLGRGGQGIVYLAEDTRLGRRVALKVLTAWGHLSDEAQRRFQREGELASKLDHRGLCTVYEVGSAAGLPYIAMRFVEGETLASLIRSRSANAPPRSSACARHSGPELMKIVRLFEQAARALHAAHERGVIHRDVKPANIMVTPAGESVLMDFGLAREILVEHDPVTLDGEIFGTPAYLSPEQLTLAPGQLDARTDVWSLGVSLYEAILLERPFSAPTKESIVQQVVSAEPPNARALDRSIPRDLAVVIETAMMKERDRRYQSAWELAEDLQAVLSHHPIRARRAGVVTRVRLWARRQPVRAALVLVSLLAFATIAGLAGALLAGQGERNAGRKYQRFLDREEALDRGFLALIRGNRARAQADFLQALRIDPAFVEALGGLVVTRLRFYDNDSALSPEQGPRAALDLLDAQSSTFGASPEFQWLRAHVLRKTGQISKAEEIESALGDTRSALRFVLDGMDALWTAYRGDHNRKVAARAERCFAEAIMRSSRPRLAFYWLRGEAASYAANDIGVAGVRASIAERWGDTQEGRIFLGLLTGGEASIAHFRRALAVDPNDADALVHCGLRLCHIGQNEEGVRVLRRCVELHPGYSFGHFALACRLYHEGELQEALAVAGRAVAINPWGPEILDVRGRIHAALGNGGAAEDDFGRASSLDPEFDGPLLHRAALRLARHAKQPEPKLRESALADLRRALEVNPTNHKGAVASAKALRKAGCPREARELLDRIVALNPDDFFVLNEVAWHFVDPDGNPDQWDRPVALALARRAVANAPEARLDVLDTLAFALHANGQNREALDLGRTVVDKYRARKNCAKVAAEAERHLATYEKAAAPP